MNDTETDRLVFLMETPGAALDNLNRMEKLGLLSSVVEWVEARNLRNRMEAVPSWLHDRIDSRSGNGGHLQWNQLEGCEKILSTLESIEDFHHLQKTA